VDEALVVVDVVDRPAESITCQTMTAAISIGEPSSSLTLSLPLSKLRTRWLTLRLA
jgi:hypothetical protein